MLITDQIDTFIRDHESKRSRTLDRDIKIVQYRYGMGGAVRPTLDEIAKMFSTKNSTLTKQRVEQVLKNRFIKKINNNNFDALNTIDKYFSDTKYIDSNKITENMISDGLMTSDMRISNLDLLALLHTNRRSTNIGLFTPELNEVSRNNYVHDGSFILIDREFQKQLKKPNKAARTLPGQLGIARMSYLSQIVENNAEVLEAIQDLLRLDPNVWTVIYDDVEYYSVYDKPNTMINYLRKSRNVTEHVNLKMLVETLWKSLSSRIPPEPNNSISAYPSLDVIEKYLKDSPFITYNGSTTTINIEPIDLEPMEDSIVAYFNALPKGGRFSDYPTLHQHLSELGYESTTINRAAFNSPLIQRDTSSGRGNYAYSLIGESGFNAVEFEEQRYNTICVKLLNAARNGTDSEQTTTHRNEQSILSRYIFNNASTIECAICGKEFVAHNLVAAHKKSRSICTEAERCDPNIVMPLCELGCHHLYDNYYIYINDGVVREEGFHNDITTAEKEYINKIVGNKLPDEWTKGPSSYFRESRQSTT